MIPKSPQQRLVLVIDTNVCLDLFVFNDPRIEPLLKALQNNTVAAITRTSCRDEWLAVLRYPQLPITEQSRPISAALYDKYVQITQNSPKIDVILPRCTDADDQQFMELARDASATHLLTKDKALLKCAKRVDKLGLFRILTPDYFIKNILNS